MTDCIPTSGGVPIGNELDGFNGILNCGLVSANFALPFEAKLVAPLFAAFDQLAEVLSQVPFVPPVHVAVELMTV